MKYKKLFLALIPTVLLSFICCFFIHKEGVDWLGIIFLITLITISQIILWTKKPQRVMDPVCGWLVAGSAYILSETLNNPLEEMAVLKTMAIFIAVFSLFITLLVFFEKRKP